VNQAQRPRHRRFRAAPRGRSRGRVGTAAQAGAKSIALGRRRAGVEAHVLQAGNRRRAARAAVDARGGDGGEEAPLEPPSQAAHRFGEILPIHVFSLTTFAQPVSPFPDVFISPTTTICTSPAMARTSALSSSESSAR